MFRFAPPGRASGSDTATFARRRIATDTGFQTRRRSGEATGFIARQRGASTDGFAAAPPRRRPGLRPHYLAASAGAALGLALAPVRRMLSPLSQALHARLGWALAWGRGLPWRRIGQAGALVGASSVAMATALVVHGYATNDPKWVRTQLAQRLGSALYDRGGALLGAMFVRQRDASGQPVDHQALGYVKAGEPVPSLFIALLLDLEHRQHFQPLRNWCGTDPLAKLAALWGGGVRGASGLAEQLAKDLLPREEQTLSSFRLIALAQKLQRVGKACAVHRALGGTQGVLDTYLDVAPFLQIGGTTRGAAPSSRTQFGVALAQATPAQMAVLAAAVQRNLVQVPHEAFALGCDKLRAMKAGEARSPDHPALLARNQCQLLARARGALQHVLPAGPQLDEALGEIASFERSGLQPVDAFAPLPSRRLVNLSVRAQTLMGPALVRDIAEAADAQELPTGSVLTLSFNGQEQSGFNTRLAAALDAVDASPAGREQLCVPLSPRSSPRRCRIPPPGFGQAELLLARTRVDDGGVTRLYHSPGASPDALRQTGSIAKLVIAAAALAQGTTPDTPVCPRAANDRGRPLRRDDREAPNGFANCESHRISFREAFAKSDSLAFFDLARQLGPQTLRRAAQALGLPQAAEPGWNPAYELAFGTLLATPAQMLAVGQAVFGLAYGIEVTATAPLLLAGSADAAPPLAYRQLAALLPAATQRNHLRTLVQAPVTDARGTLHALQRGSDAVAGKSGTTSSPYRPAPGLRPYLQAKLSLTYQASDRTVALTIISGGAPHPLAQAAMPAEVLNPVRMALLR